MDNDLWSIRNYRSLVDSIEELINDPDCNIPMNWLVNKRHEYLKIILEIQLKNWKSY